MTCEVKRTSQRQITIPKKVCERLHLKKGDRLQVEEGPGMKLVLRPRKSIDVNDPAYRLAQEILEAEKKYPRRLGHHT